MTASQTFAVLAVVVGLVVGIRSLPPAAAGAAGQAQTFTVEVGDKIVTDGGRVGCIVRRRAPDVVLDCRRAGPLRGSYGTVIGRNSVLVVRFLSNRLARRAFSARHGGPVTCCR